MYIISLSLFVGVLEHFDQPVLELSGRRAIQVVFFLEPLNKIITEVYGSNAVVLILDFNTEHRDRWYSFH